MIPYEAWEIVYEDSELDVRIDPQEPQGYGLHIKDTENFLIFSRGTLKEIALANRDSGKRILENLMPIIEKEGRLFQGTNLNHDSIIAATTKVYLEEEKRYNNWANILG